MRKLCSALLAAGLQAFTLSAHAAGVDWKAYGSAKLQGDDLVICFYEERGITRPKPGLVDVWAKCISQKIMDNVPQDAPYYRSYIDMAAQRLAHSYRPPILSVERMNYDQIVETISDETLADVAELASQAEFYYELDCRQRMVRELSMTLGSNYSKETPSDWSHVPPEGNVATLLLLLCPR